MAATNANDLMGVAVETPNAEENDISDLENEIDYPSQGKVNSTRVSYPSWLVDTPNAKSAGPPHQVSITVDGSLDPHDIAPVDEASTSQLNANTPAGVNIHFAKSAADSLRVSLALAEECNAMHIAITAALAYHTVLMVDHHQKLEVSGNVARI